METDSKAFEILIIEDNPGDLILAEEFLTEQKVAFKLTQARTFREARQILLAGIAGFDVILLDLSLPDKMGLPLIQEMIAISFSIPIIVLTGFADISFSVKSLSMGISDYLLKDDLSSSMLYKSIIYSIERKKSILALEASEKKYSELFNLIPLPTYVLELDSSQFLDVNEAFLISYGYSRAEILSMNLDAILPPEEKNNHSGKLRHIKKSREIIYVDIQSNLIKYKEKNAEMAFANDITDRLNYISSMEYQNEKLRAKSWTQSHVFRAPLSRIIGLIPIFRLKDYCHNKFMFLKANGQK
ncbi:response regulator [Pedobacter hartonius]|uniref:PAS domain S-box-containing protein n=1 Tax=Pedobacter hartonius TaxID=425514 RepID=A0A1H4GQG6_9SPHI|nr:response regulator [Pedobacter hartonius]SEB11845.1 PAS domain S-box-containing protein [Pedobacter hartonius]